MADIKHAASAFLQWKRPEFELEDTLAERLFVDFEIDLCQSMLRVRPDHVLSLLIVGHLYTRTGRHIQALGTDRTLTSLLPEDPTVRYNLACSHSNLHQIPEALSALDEAIQLGYRDFEFMARDPDLENLRNDPRFGPFLARCRKEHEEG